MTQIAKLEVGDGKVTAHREVEGATETVESPLPVVLAAEKGLNEPRYPSLKGIMAAKKKPVGNCYACLFRSGSCESFGDSLEHFTSSRASGRENFYG